MQGERSSKSNQPCCRDPIPSCPQSYTEPIITVQRLQQLGSLFSVYIVILSIFKYVCRKYILGMLKTNYLLFFFSICIHTCIHAYSIYISINIYICCSRFYFPLQLRWKRELSHFPGQKEFKNTCLSI